MRITICGSMSAAQEMYKVYKELVVAKGHQVILPEFVLDYINGNLDWELGSLSFKQAANKKKDCDLIRKHYSKIEQCDAILVVNQKKHNVENYIGANTFMEIGFAYILNKKIYLLNELPDFPYLLEEILAMDPIVLSRDLNKIRVE